MYPNYFKTIFRIFPFINKRGCQIVLLARMLKWNRMLNAKTFGMPTGVALGLSFWKAADTGPKAQLKEILTNADQMYDAYLIDALYTYLKENHQNFPNDVEILWRLARAACDKGKQTETYQEKKQLIYEGFGYIEKALAKDPNHFAIHKWYAILLNYVGEIEGTKEQINKSYIVREHFRKATELNPNDPTSWHLLGVWHYTFADLPWYQRQVASLIFGKPPHATFEEALELFEKAESIKPNFYSENLLMLAKTYLKLKRDDLAKEYLHRTLRYVCVTVDEKNAHDEAYSIMKEKKWHIPA